MSQAWQNLSSVKREINSGDAIAIVWFIDDVAMVAPTLSDEECRTVLEHAHENFDGRRGINWEVLAEYVKELYPGTDIDGL